MNFQEYLDKIDTSILAGGNQRGALLDAVPDPGIIPTRKELIAFLGRLNVALAVETRKTGAAKDAGQVDRRQNAILQIADFVANDRAPTAFTNINKYLFAYQLALRVRSPRVINQRQYQDRHLGRQLRRHA